MSITRKLYVALIRPFLRSPLRQQHVRLLWFARDYIGVFSFKTLTFKQKLFLLRKFLIIDWQVLHGHRPSEIVVIGRAICERPARNGEIMVEAGCYNGGSSAKFSLICKMLGYKLRVYDSFEGVEPMTDEAKRGTYDFSGQYAADEESVRENVERYGEISVCAFYKGWFADTLAKNPPDVPVRVAYIDCDVAKGTQEALAGIIPALAPGGYIFSQDFHIKPVREMLQNTSTWASFNLPMPSISFEGGNLALIKITE